MCGIAGTIYKKDFSPGTEVTYMVLSDCFQSMINGEKDIDLFIEKCWEYKSNINFLRYCKDDNERNNIEILCNRIKSYSKKFFRELPLIDKSRSSQIYIREYKKYEKLLDSEWFLSNDIKNWFRQIEYYVDDNLNNLDDSSIVFYKNLATVINSINNRLEIRGRDSLGISIQFFSSELMDFDGLNDFSSNNSEKIYCENFKSHSVITFIFKTANRIGSLGDNAFIIKKMIKENKFLHKIISNREVYSGTIIIHTRWASVGEVSLNNCHPITNSISGYEHDFPLTTAILNGDIYNYENIISKKLESYNLVTDEGCSTDALAIPMSLTGENIKNMKILKEIFNNYVGSFAFAVQNSELVGEIILCSRGSQGLYLGFSSDGLMFASDIYGLVESCRFFYPVKSKSLLSISLDHHTFKNNHICVINNLENDDVHRINKDELKKTDITTRDIDKNKYNHFLEKEIYETKDIVEKTILAYLQSPDLIDKNYYHNAIIIDDNQVPKHIIDRIKKGEIKNIVITGMGTCYTAAVAISRYMKDMLREYFNDIRVRAHIASEGSAFYLKPSMNDTLVIVIAQSGTTVDTNVYVQMANKRGAMSLAIANKREGDVTFIVDGTLYIGSGRDIEIAVPSTKTYTAQVILGYILTLYFCCQLNKLYKNQLPLNLHVENLRLVPNLIDETFNYFLKNKKILKKTLLHPLRYNSWYLVHDNSPNAVCAMELRIKLSEGCYHSLPYLHINDIQKKNVNKSLMIYISNENIKNIEEELIELIDKKNMVILINSDDDLTSRLKNLEKKNKFSFINIPYSEQSYSFIPTVITGQLFSYYSALALDKRKEYFNNLKKAIQSNILVEEKWEDLNKWMRKGIFNQGFSNVHFIQLNDYFRNYVNSNYKMNSFHKEKIVQKLDDLYQLSKRPIDTIKHQAKTLTVGAVREAPFQQTDEELIDTDYSYLNNEDENLNRYEIKNLFSAIDNYEDSFLSENVSQFKQFIVYPIGIDQSYGYSIISFVNEIINKYNLKCEFKLGFHYDIKNGENNPEAFWIFLSDTKRNGPYEVPNHFNRGFYIHYDFSANENFNYVRYIPKFFHNNNNLNINSLNSIFIASVFSKLFCEINNASDYWLAFNHKNLTDLNKSLNYVEHSNLFNQEIHAAAKILLSKRNWKCVGSGVNYNIAKFVSKKIIGDLNRSCAFDVLENHKHIDISAEGAVITFIANILSQGYQSDVTSEIDKLLSHDNIPIIITNHGDKRFDKFQMKVNYGLNDDVILSIPIVKYPRVNGNYSFPINNYLAHKLIGQAKNILTANNIDVLSTIALSDPSSMQL